MIYERMPLDFERYIECFGGGGWVLFGMPDNIRSTYDLEVYNDVNSNLTNMFQCVRYKPLEFIKELGFLPLHSRVEFEAIRDHLSKEKVTDLLIDDLYHNAEYFSEEEMAELEKIIYRNHSELDVQQAADFFKLIRLSYASGCVSFSSRPFNIRKCLSTIWEASYRLSNTVIENKSFDKLINQYDRDGAFFYLDPPYYEAESFYEAAFGLEDHIHLHEVLSRTKGKWLLSYNDCEFIRDLYQGYYLESLTRTSNMTQRYEAGSVYEELLISNYDTSLRKQALKQCSLFE